MAGPLIGLLSKAGGAMFGSQVGEALAGLAGEVLTASDVGLPLGPVAVIACSPTVARPGTVMVASDHGTCAPGEIGEVHVRGATVMPGYLDNPDANRAAFVDGWFRTGDLGSIDHDGFLTLHGRAKELINRGGEKIAPAEVEAAMLRHPAVSECAAFGIAHPRLGDEVAAAVVLRTGMTASGTELKNFASKCLAPFKIHGTSSS